MQLRDILLCDRPAKAVRAEVHRKDIADSAVRLCGLDASVLFTTRTRPLVPATEEILRTRPHLACEHTRGARRLLYLCKHEFTNTSWLIDRYIARNQQQPAIAWVHCAFEESLYKGTVLAGELIHDASGAWSLVLDDVYCVAGQSLVRENFKGRLHVLNDIVARGHQADRVAPFSLAVKAYVDYSGIEDLRRTAESIAFRSLHGHHCDIVTDAHGPVQQTPPSAPYAGRDRREQRRRNDRVFDAGLVRACKDDVQRLLYVQRSLLPDIYDLFEFQHAGASLAQAGVQTLARSRELRSLFEDKSHTTRVLMMCEYDTETRKWTPLRIAPR